MSMLLNMDLKDFFSSGGEQHSCFLLKLGRWVDTCWVSLRTVPLGLSVVTPLLFLIWGCTWQTWRSLKKEHQTLLRKASSISPRWEWWVRVSCNQPVSVTWVAYREEAVSRKSDHLLFHLHLFIRHWVWYPMLADSGDFRSPLSAGSLDKEGGDSSPTDDFLRLSSDRQMLKAACWTAGFWALGLKRGAHGL